MDVILALKATARRWYIFVPVFALGALFALQQYRSAEPVFEASTQLIVLNSSTISNPSVSRGEDISINPYSTQINGAAAAVAGLTAESADAVTESGLSAEFVALADPQAPVVVITASSSDATNSREALDAFVDQVDDRFEQLQVAAGSPPEQLLQVQRLTIEDPAVVAGYPNRSRTVAAILVGGGVLAALVATAFDALMRRRRQRADRMRQGDREVVEPVSRPQEHA